MNTAQIINSLLNPKLINERNLRLFACDCAEHVLHFFEKKYPNDKRPREAIEVARKFANGKATKEELDKAYAARAYAADAAYAAAAYAAAYYAAAAADAAAYYAAANATHAAAHAAARAAAAARTAAAAAARTAATDAAERKWQLNRLAHYVHPAVFAAAVAGALELAAEIADSL